MFEDTRFISRVEHDISHSFAALTREISCSTLEINLVFRAPMNYSLFNFSKKQTSSFTSTSCNSECYRGTPLFCLNILRKVWSLSTVPTSLAIVVEVNFCGRYLSSLISSPANFAPTMERTLKQILNTSSNFWKPGKFIIPQHGTDIYYK